MQIKNLKLISYLQIAEFHTVIFTS